MIITKERLISNLIMILNVAWNPGGPGKSEEYALSAAGL